ncbi:MAG: hypothetical protein E7235_01680 [Lachnospiraceae bacterium]|nr:hypothetical protein [Lachnospiraceae bacterium]
MVKKRRSASYKKKNKKDRLSVKAFFSLLLVVFALAAANLSFLSFARDTLHTAVSEDMDLEGIKEVLSSSVMAIKEIMNNGEEEEKESEIINTLPPEMILPETE